MSLDIIKQLIKYSLKNISVKGMFAVTLFERFLLEGRSVLQLAKDVTESERGKISVKNQKNVRLLLELLD